MPSERVTEWERERCVIRPAPLASSKAVWAAGTDAGAGLGPSNFNMGGASYQISGSGRSDKNATKSRNSRIIVQIGTTKTKTLHARYKIGPA